MHPSVWNDMKKQNKLRLNPEELWQRLQETHLKNYEQVHRGQKLL